MSNESSVRHACFCLVRVRQLPHAPENPVAVLSRAEKRAINLTWAQAFDGNSPLIRYILEVSENSEWIRFNVVPLRSPAEALRGLLTSRQWMTLDFFFARRSVDGAPRRHPSGVQRGGGGRPHPGAILSIPPVRRQRRGPRAVQQRERAVSFAQRDVEEMTLGKVAFYIRGKSIFAVVETLMPRDCSLSSSNRD